MFGLSREIWWLGCGSSLGFLVIISLFAVLGMITVVRVELSSRLMRDFGDNDDEF